MIRSSSSLSSSNGGVGGCYSAPSTLKMNQQNQTSNQSLAQILATNQSTQNVYEQYIDCIGTGTVTQTILPPPLFDTNCSNGNYNQCYEIQNYPGNYCTLSAIDNSKFSSSSKRLHRTIPKHFTMSSPSSSVVLPGESTQQQHRFARNNESKKSSCQCNPIHVPMNNNNTPMAYMQFPAVQNLCPAQQPIQELVQHQQNFSQPQHHQHSIYMSGSKKHNIIKSPSNMNSVSKTKTTANSELVGPGQGLNSNVDLSRIIIPHGGGTLRRHKYSPNENSVTTTTPTKKSIATISVANSCQNVPTPEYFTTKQDIKHHQPMQIHQIHSILKNKKDAECHVNGLNVIEGGSEQNPTLPPKMYKTSSNKYTSMSTNSGSVEPSSSKQIHTISRPNELTTSSSHFSLLTVNGSSQKYQQQSPQFQHQQQTQLRTNIQVKLLNQLPSKNIKKKLDEKCYEPLLY